MAGGPDRTGRVLWPFFGVIGFYVGESAGISEIRRFASHRSRDVLPARIFAFIRPGSSGKNIKKIRHCEFIKISQKNFRK